MDNGYINGGDVLVALDGVAVGHCTSHTASYESDLKTITCKRPMAKKEISNGKFDDKLVTGQSVSVDVEGMQYLGDDETLETNQKAIRKAWKTGIPVVVILFTRGSEATPYTQGKFIIKSYKETNPPKEIATWSASLENTGEVLVDEEIIANKAQSKG